MFAPSAAHRGPRVLNSDIKRCIFVWLPFSSLALRTILLM
jgi:hypothetical protein